MCIANRGNEASLTLHRVYKIITDEKAALSKMIRVVDDTGKDYLVIAIGFVPVELSIEAESNFELVVA